MIYIMAARQTILSDGNKIKISNHCTFVISIITEFMVSHGLATDRVKLQRAFALPLHKK